MPRAKRPRSKASAATTAPLKLLKPKVCNTAKQRIAWFEKRDRLFDNPHAINPTQRAWAILTETHDLVMLDRKPFVDEDGDDMVRIVYRVDKDGTLSEDHGHPRVSSMSARAKYVQYLSKDWNTKLDAWVQRYTTEDAEEHGFVYKVMVLKPWTRALPGWERYTAKKMKKAKEQSIQNIMAMFRVMRKAGM